MTFEGAFDLGLALARQLERRGVPYALGGALALGAAGVVRATHDVDVNVFVPADGLANVFEALTAVGAPVEAGRAQASAATEGLFEAWSGPFRIDVFVPSIPFSWEAGRARIRIRIEGEEIAFLSAESLAVFKLLFFRAKDLVDLEELLKVRPSLQVDTIRAHLVEMMGESDERVVAWDGIVRRARPRP